MPITVNAGSDEPLYHQIARAVRARIVSGHYPPGAALPTVRAVGSDTGVSSMTVQRAYKILEADHLIRVNRKGARVVRRSKRRESSRSDCLLELLYDSAFGLAQVGIGTDEIIAVVRNAVASPQVKDH